MIVSDTEKFIFIHNPKCAGMSIRSCLLHYDTSNNWFSGWRYFDNKKLGMAHLPLWKLNELFPLFIDSKMRKYYTFVVVRNPYARAISSFNMIGEDSYLKYTENGSIDDYRQELNSFLERLDSEKIDSLDYRYRHFIRQSDYVYLNNEKLPDTIFKFENIPHDFYKMDWMNTTLSHRLKTNLKHLNQRFIINDPTDLLSQTSKDVISKIYEKDFENLGYQVS